MKDKAFPNVGKLCPLCKKGIIAYNLGETRLRGKLRENKPLPAQYFKKIWENYNMLKEKYDV